MTAGVFLAVLKHATWFTNPLEQVKGSGADFRSQHYKTEAGKKRDYPPIMENQMEKKMENEMETGGI